MELIVAMVWLAQPELIAEVRWLPAYLRLMSVLAAPFATGSLVEQVDSETKAFDFARFRWRAPCKAAPTELVKKPGTPGVSLFSERTRRE